MKYCTKCGTQLDDNATFCSVCGTKQTTDVVKADDPFAQKPQTEQQTAQPAESPIADPFERSNNQPSEQPPEQSAPKSDNKFLRTVNDVVGKAKTFEQKHSIILNAIVMACAIVVIFIALFAPVKLPFYTLALTETDDNEFTSSYADVDQSIYQLIGSLSYINASEEKTAKIEAESESAMQKAQAEIIKWRLAHLDATEEETQNASIEIIANYLSDINYLGLVLATSKDAGITSGLFIDAIISMVFGIVVAIMAIVMAIVSLIHIIFAILNIVQKKPQLKLYKYLSTILALSVYSLTIIFCTPMFKVGGGMMAIALFTALAYLIFAGVGGLLFGKESKRVLLKRSIIAIISIIAFFILCSNVFSIVNTTEYGHTSTNVPTGFGCYGILLVMGAHDPGTLLANSLVGVILYILVAGGVVSYTAIVMRRALRRLAFGTTGKSGINGYAIAAAIFALMSIIVGFVSPSISSAFLRIFEVESVESNTVWLMRAQIWVCMIFMIALVILNNVFLPGDVVKNRSDKTQPVTQEPDDADII